ncbi:MAG: hypothetical protein D6771_01095, partial [Zetaproteobacteria bacterium]
ALAKFRSADAKLMVVLNGGQKLSPFGAVLAARLWRDEWKKPVAFLYGEDRRAAVVVREARMNVRVKEAEWDVALALANGVVLVLECKSGTTEKKEIDARAQNLQRATSRLANIYVVAPFFAELDDEPWFQAEMHNKWQSLQADFGDRLIAFTMRGTAAKDYGATKDGKPIRCEAPRPFEDRLAEILARYAQPAC